ncbi:MAG: hypothetical protein WCW40_01475 [Bacteroidota bacterium]
MNEIIDPKESPEFSPVVVRWLISLTIVVLMLVFVFEPRINRTINKGTDFSLPAGAIAARAQVEYGITEFQGAPIEPIAQEHRTRSLLYLLFGFVVIPTATFFLVQRMNSEEERGSMAILSSSIRTVMFLLFLCATALVFITTASASIYAPIIFENMRIDNAISEERDGLTRDLVKAYSDVIIYSYSTKKYGGKNKDLRDIRTISEIGSPEKTQYGSLHLQPMISDSAISVIAVGTIPIEKNTYKDADGRTGFAQYTVHIFPAKLLHTIERNN